MRKISLKKVVFAATAISTTALIPALIGCSIHYEHEEDDPSEPILKTINMTLPEDMPERIAIGNVQTTKAINVKCLDEQGNPIKAITSFNFKDDKGNVPTWISIQSDRKFHIDANVEVGTYNFVISAQAKQNDIQVESEPQPFSIEVYDDQPVVGPDQIEITCNDVNPLVFTTSTADIDLGLIATRSDYPQHLVSKECDWDITKLIGAKDTDLDNNPLFALDVRTESAQIKMSTNVDSSYEGIYQLTIKAISVLEPFASDEIVITLNVVDGLNYKEADKQGYMYYFSRQSINLTWTLDHVDSRVSSINKPRDYIYDIPVTKIANNFCSRSGISLGGVKLLETYTTIGDNAFSNQINLFGLELPGVKYVGESAFENCQNVSFYTTKPHPRLEVVEKRAFYNCSTLEINSVNSFSQIGEEAFAKSGIKEINLGGCVWSIAKNCFDHCPDLKDITIGAANPPQLEDVLYTSGTPLEHIHVPGNSIETYENSTNWSIYAGKYVPIEEN